MKSQVPGVFRRWLPVALMIFVVSEVVTAAEFVTVINGAGEFQQNIRPQLRIDRDCCPPNSSSDGTAPPLVDSLPSPNESPQPEQERAQLTNEQFAGLGSSMMTVADSAGAGQASAPYLMGDLYSVGTSTITIPVLTGPGTPFMSPINIPGPLAPSFIPQPPDSFPVEFSTPAFPGFSPGTFVSVQGSSIVNQNFMAGQHNFAVASRFTTFNQEAQSALETQYPQGTNFANGQTASGGGTAQFISGQAVLDSPPPPPGTPISNTDYFNLTANYLYTPDVYFSPQQPTTFVYPYAGNSGAAVLGINKIAENTSPLPRDRVFFNYSLFGGTPLAPGGVNVNRFVPGFEKTFFDNWASVEMRFPFAATISPDLVLANNGITNTGAAVFGNMSVIFKSLLRQTDSFALSAGLQTVVPTAPSLSLSLPDGRRIIDIPNQAVHAMPFIGAIYTPNARFFAQGFVQADIDVNGNPVYLNPTLQNLVQVGRLHGVNLLFVDLNMGYWLQRSRGGSITGIAPTMELHYNQSVEAVPYLASSGFMIGSNLGQVSNQSVTVGCYIEYEQLTTLAIGYTAPMGNGVDQTFDGELRAFVTRRFGSTSRASRVAF